MNNHIPARRHLAYTLAVALPTILLAGAYGFQFFAGIVPCEMCWWQRYAHVGALALALTGLMLARKIPPARDVLTVLAALALALAAGIGLYQAGIENGWWTGITACTSMVSFSGGKDPLAAIMNAPLVRCDVVQWSMFGISMAGYDFLASGAGALFIIWALLTGRKGSV